MTIKATKNSKLGISFKLQIDLNRKIIKMKTSVKFWVIASFITLCAFEVNCHNYEKVLQKRDTDEKANDPTMKEMFAKKDKRQAEYDEEKQHAFDGGKKEDTKSKRDAPEMFEEGFKNFKDKTREGMDKMKEMFAPKSKRQADMKDNKENGEKKTEIMGRRNRDVTETSTTEASRA